MRMKIRYWVATFFSGLILVGGAHAASITIDLGNSGSREHHDGPPPHAPAHGHRAKHHYHYYPAAEVYFDDRRGMYFYFSDSAWRASVSLPLTLKLKLGEHVTIDMDSDQPYSHHAEHKKRHPSRHGRDDDHGHGGNKHGHEKHGKGD